MTFQPQPSGHCDALDVWGNTVTMAWFHEKHAALSITAASTLETLRENPFDYLLVGDQAQQLPMRYEPSLQKELWPYLEQPAVEEPVERWAGELAATSRLPQPFLAELVSCMFNQFERNTREVGAAFDSATTFASQAGTCRDLAVLFIAACRSQGIAARFVSGYAHEQDREGSSDLHAWAEVYLPGAGWRGYDPTLGVAVTDQHIPVAAAAEPLGAAPTSGTFRGTAVVSAIEFDVKIVPLRDSLVP
jgi:transglutaminase-like putative cysteine protease